MRPSLLSAARSGYDTPMRIVLAVTPVADAVSFAVEPELDPGVVVLDDLLEPDELQAAAATTASTVRPTALRNDRARIGTSPVGTPPR